MRLHFIVLILILGTLSSAACGGDLVASSAEVVTTDTGASDAATSDTTVSDTDLETTAAADADTSELGRELPPGATAFAPDPMASGPHLAIAVRFDIDGDPALLEVDIVARAPGALFGLSYHLGYDPAALWLEGPLTQAAILGPEAEAAYVIAHGPGDVALGGSRRAPTLGNTAVADGVVLATLRFRGVPESASRLVLTRTYGRTADAALVPLAGGRGTLTLGPRAPEASP